MNPEIVLDVPYENLKNILSDRGWNVTTVTKKLGPTKEDREDKNILEHAKEEKFVVITDDAEFVERLKGANIVAFTIDVTDKANIIDEKLKVKFDEY